MKNLMINKLNEQKSLAEIMLSREEFEMLGTREEFEMSRMDAQDQRAETLID